MTSGTSQPSKLFIAFFVINAFQFSPVRALFPQASESRQIQELDGFWNFRADFSESRDQGFKNEWFSRALSETGPVIAMPTCSSFNDITVNKDLQKFVGWVWYDKTFFVDPNWSKKRVVLRVESAHYNAIVWVNGKLSVTHSGGHLPFEAEANGLLKFHKSNRVTIAVNNTLTPHTLPPGFVQYPEDATRYPPGFFVQNTRFDFFNYAGLHRKVRLYTTPKQFVRDISVTTISADLTSARVEFAVDLASCSTCTKGDGEEPGGDRNISVVVKDRDGNAVAASQEAKGAFDIKKPRLWWPHTMASDYGYLYTLKVHYGEDIYRQKFGIRTITANNRSLLINGKPFYCLGVNKHEDSDIRGKGLDLPLLARDFNLLEWLGVNCFRTSHYPYAEETLDAADERGVVVIDECPAVGLKTKENFGHETLSHHLDVMKELVARDKNHPSVVAWSIANEPAGDLEEADSYFRKVSEFTRVLDSSRLVTMAISDNLKKDHAAKYLDFLCINRYYAWYQDMGHLATIRYKLLPELEGWHEAFGKPIVVSEYGADTVEGLHTVPSQAFSEEYQVDFLSEYHRVFDELRSSFLTGEMVWNFADFMTDEAVNRVIGNRKGLLTRQRQPKFAAHVVRKRYWSIINSTSSR